MTDVDRFVAFVKRDCATCELIVPVLAQLREAIELEIVTQDDPGFPSDVGEVDFDDDLFRSWSNDIETVPTLLRMVDGDEADRVVGWERGAWESITGVADLGPELTAYSPGCGSMSVEPDVADRLTAAFGGDGLASRRIEFAELEDEFEAMYQRGWSDGLPLVPPTPARVSRMLEGTTRDPSDVVAVTPPNLVEASVEKVAVNAVMAGCRPEYLPVVLAAVEAACTDAFNMHGILATTMGVGPVIVVNGPIRREIGMNAGINVLGPGNRANATIGRALQLVVRNVGGGRPGEIDRATHGSPAKYGLCFPEDEEGSPWGPLSADRGVEAGVDSVTLFCGEAPRIIFDQQSRSPEALTASITLALRANVSPRITGMDAMLVLSPEHMARYADAGWTKPQFLDALHEQLLVDCDTIMAGVDGIGEGIPPGLGFEGQKLPKFSPDGGLLVVHAGGPAGLFSSTIAGWVSGEMGSVPVTREIVR